MVVGRVADVRDSVAWIVHVPHASVVGPRVVVANNLAGRGGTPAHDELGAVRHRRERHPDEGRSIRMPFVDFEREASPVHIDEAQVIARGRRQVAVGEPDRRVRGYAHEDRKVSERGLAGGIALDSELRAFGEGCGGWRRQSRQCLRSEHECECRQHGECVFVFHHGVTPDHHGVTPDSR